MYCTACGDLIVYLLPQYSELQLWSTWKFMFMHQIGTGRRSCIHYQSDADTQMVSDSPSPWAFLLLESSARSKAPLPKLRTIFSASLWKSIAQNQLSQYFPILNTASQAASPAAHLNTHKKSSRFPENESVHRAFAQLSLQTGGQRSLDALHLPTPLLGSICPGAMSHTTTGKQLNIYTSHLLNL